MVVEQAVAGVIAMRAHDGVQVAKPAAALEDLDRSPGQSFTEGGVVKIGSRRHQRIQAPSKRAALGAK